MDITLKDNDIYDQIGVNVESVYSLDIIYQLKEANLDTHRVSKYVKVNEFGRHIVEFCRSNNMIILNGRTFHDKGIGKTTCKDNVVCKIRFQFKDYCVLFSDAPSPLEMSLNVYLKKCLQTITHKSTKVKV